MEYSPSFRFNLKINIFFSIETTTSGSEADGNVSSSDEFAPLLTTEDSDESYEPECDEMTVKIFSEKRENVKKNIFCEQNRDENVENQKKLRVLAEGEKFVLAGSQITSSNNTRRNLNCLHVTAEGEETISNNINRKRKVFALKQKTSRKRLRNPEEWKRRKSSVLREKGLEYVSQTGKVIPQKKIKEDPVLCKAKCKLQCGSKFSLEARKEILDRFYKLDNSSKTCILFKSIDLNPVSRHRIRAEGKKQSLRQYSFKYSVILEMKKILVCKDAFCALYQIGAKKVRNIQKQLKSGQAVPSPCHQGKHTNRPHKICEEVIDFVVDHIKMFPSEHSHYSRNKNENKKYLSPLLNITKMYELYIEKCKEQGLDDKYFVKLSMYRHVFETKFNLSFGHPKSDTCSTCDSGEGTTEHKMNYTTAFESQKADRQKPLSDNSTCYVTMDLQQTMPLPKLSTSKAFYLRQMWLYNFGVHCITSLGTKSYFFTWTEDVANRGSFEIANCLFRFCKLLKEDNPQVNHLIIWSDSCSGQNKNHLIICLYQYLILNRFFEVIEHKFPEVGHSYLDSDRDFGRIEKVIRRHQNIFIPDQYRDIIKSASSKNSVCVNMENFFHSLEELPAKLGLFKKQRNSLNDKVCFRDNVKWVRVDEFGCYRYKTCLDDYTPFQLVDLRKKGTENVDRTLYRPTRLTNKIGGLTSEKLENLKAQIRYVDEDYKWFFEHVLQENVGHPKKKRKTC